MNDLFEGFEGVKPVEAASDPFADFEGVTPVDQAAPAVGDPLSAFRAKLADPKEYERIKRFAGYLGTTPEDPIVAKRLTNPLNFSSYSTLNQLKTTGNVDEANRMTPEGNVEGLGLKAALMQFGHAGGVLRRRNDALVGRIAAGQELEVGDTRDIKTQIATGMAGAPRPNLRIFKKVEDMTRAEQDATVPKEIIDLVNQYDTPEAPLDARTRAKAIYEAAKSSATARARTMEMAKEELALREELAGKSGGFLERAGVLAAKGVPTVGYSNTFLILKPYGAAVVSGMDKTSELLSADIDPDTGEVVKQGTDYDDARLRGYAYGGFEAATEVLTSKILGAVFKGADKLLTGGRISKGMSKGYDALARKVSKRRIGMGIAEFAKGVQRIADLSATNNPFTEILGEEGIQQWGDAVFAQRPSDTETPVYVKNVFNEATGEMEQMQVEPGSDEERTAKRMLARYGEKSGYAEAGTRQMTVGEKTKEFGEEFFTWENLTALAEGFALQYALTLGGGALHAVKSKESRVLVENALLAAGHTNADIILMSDEKMAKAFDSFYGAEANREEYAEIFKDAGEMLSLSAQRVVDSELFMRTGEGIKPNFKTDIAKGVEGGAATLDDEKSGFSVDYTSTLEGTAFTVRDRDGILKPATFNTAEEAQKGAEKMSQLKQGRQLHMEKRAEIATRVAQVFAPGRNVVLVQSDKDMKAAAVAEGADAAQYRSGAPGLTAPNGTIVLNVAATTSFDELVQTVKHETGHSVADEAGLTKLMAGKTVDGIAAEFQKAGIIASGAGGLEKFVKAVESVRAKYAARGVKLADADAVAEVLSMQQEGMTPLFRKKFGDGLVTLLRGKDKSAKNMRDVRRAVALIMYSGREAKVDLYGGPDAWKAPAPAFTGDPIAAAGTETGEKEAVEPAQGEEASGAEAVPPVAVPEAKPPATPSPEAKAAAKDIKAAFEEKQKAKAPVDEAAPVETPPEAPKADAPKAEPPAPATPVAKMTFPSEEAMLEYVAAHQEETENWTEESFEIVPAPVPAKSDGAPIVPTSDAGRGEAEKPKETHSEQKERPRLHSLEWFIGTGMSPEAARKAYEGERGQGKTEVVSPKPTYLSLGDSSFSKAMMGESMGGNAGPNRIALNFLHDGEGVVFWGNFQESKPEIRKRYDAGELKGGTLLLEFAKGDFSHPKVVDVFGELPPTLANVKGTIIDLTRPSAPTPTVTPDGGTNAEIDAEKAKVEAQRKEQETKDEIAKKAAAPLKGDMGDTTPDDLELLNQKPKEAQNADQERGAKEVAGGKQARSAEADGGGDAQGSKAAGTAGKPEGEGLQERAVEVAAKNAEVEFDRVPMQGSGRFRQGGEYVEIPGVSVGGKRTYLSQSKRGNAKVFYVSSNHHGKVLNGMAALMRVKGASEVVSGVRIIGGGKAPEGSGNWTVKQWESYNQDVAKGKIAPASKAPISPKSDAKPVEVSKKPDTIKTEPPAPAPKMKFASEEEMMRYVSAHPELNWTGDEFEIVPDEKGEAAPAAPQAEQEAAPAVAQFVPPKIKYGENTAAHRRRVAAAKAEWDKEQAAKADADKVSPEPRQSIDKVEPTAAKDAEEEAEAKANAETSARVNTIPDEVYIDNPALAVMDVELPFYEARKPSSVRTPDSKERQAYSTPPPLAAIGAAALAGAGGGNADAVTVIEPTAGNGGLIAVLGLSEGDKVLANELDEGRAARLSELFPDISVTQGDYAAEAYQKAIVDAKTTPRAFLMNPPFGPADESGYKLEHKIALKTIESAVPGDTLFFIGAAPGRNAMKMTTGALAGVYTAGAFAKFHQELNRRGWKATLHFIADGALYRKMGASFPVEVLLMEKTDGSEMNPHMPMRDLPARYSTWEQIRAAVAEMYDPGAETLGERVANDLNLSGKAEQARAEAQGNAEASSAEVNAARVKEGTAGTIRYRLSQDIELGLVTPETGLTLNPFMMKINGKVWDKEFAGKVRNPDQLARHILSLPAEIAEARIKVADAIAKHLAANPANGFITGTGFHSMGPALREAFEARWNAARTTDMDAEEDKAQLEYAPSSAVKVASPMKMPRELAGGMAAALSSFDERHPEGIDTFVAEKMGWPLAQATDGRLDGSQMDTLGLALEKIDEGTGFIVGSQCVAGETRIYDPRTGEHRTIRELCEKGEPITVLSLTPDGLVPTAAGVPFLKGVDDLYRVTMDDGRSITVTREHRFLTPDGWQSISAGLRAGRFLASAEGHPACSLGFAPSTLPEGDPRSSDTVQDCPANCRHDHRSCDAQPRSEADSAQASAPLPACVPEHILSCCGADGLVTLQECTPSCPECALPSKNGSSPLASRDPSRTCIPTALQGVQAETPTPQSERPSRCSSTLPRQESDETQLGLPVGGASCLSQPATEASRLPHEDSVEHDTRSCLSPVPHAEDACPRDTAQQSAAVVRVKAPLCEFSLEYHTGWRRIAAIEFVRTDEFFDMVVPGAANYTAEGFVNHNTGAGKGRVMASVIDYHRKQGRVPIFLTAQAKLFTDIWRDLTATGGADALKPLVMNDYKTPKNEDPDSEDADAFSMPMFFTPVQRGSALSEGKLPQGANAIFLTYSQVQNPTANTRRKIDLIKKLLASGKGALVMDEAHLAAGADSNRGEVLREFADLAKPGVVFSSATFAKRGENMTLYKRAGYSQFFKNDEDMEKALMVGGVPFQQYLAARLTEQGFYVRHELDYENVVFAKLTTIDTLGTPQEQTALSQHEEQIADVFNQVVRTVMQFGGLVRSVNRALRDKKAPEANMEGAQFMNSLHNTASFIYTALKAETVANAAVAELRAGRAPVVTLYNTNQALLTEIGLNQSANVGRYLTRISERAVSIKMPDGSSASILTPAGFGELVRLVKAQEATMLRDAADALVRQARSAADYLREQNLPASPIDRVREIVQNADYQFGEVTGRTLMVQDGVVVRRIKPNPDTVIRQFNQGAPDGSPNMVLLLNSSGSTGLSAHASSDFRNQARRVMFVLQPSWDINEMMQMFGRVNRKNQLSKPIYHLVFTSAAGEQRNAAILMSKLRSLSANTSGVSKAGYGEEVEDALDFMNAFGDKALAELAAERNPVVASINTLRASKTIRTATSISQFLPVREQEEFIGQIQAKVAALQDNAREAGLHDLEAGDIGRVPLSVEQLLSNSAMRAYEVPVLGRGKILTASEAVAAAQAWRAKHPTMLDDAKAKIDKAIADTSNPWLKRIYGDTAQVLEHALDSIGQVYYVRDDVSGERRWFVPIEVHLPPSGTAQTVSDWRVKVSFNTIRGVTTIPLSIFADKILSNAAKSSERNYNETLTRKEDRTIIAGDVAQALIGNIVATGASGASQIVRALPVDGNFSSFVLMMPRGITVANAKKIASSRLEKVTDVMDIRVGQGGYLEIDAGRVKVTPTYSSTTGDQIGAVFAFRIATPVKSKSKEITVAQIMRAAKSESHLRDTPNSQGYVTGPYLGVDESNTALKNLAALHPALQATQIVSDEAKVGGQDVATRNAPRFRLPGVKLEQDAEYIAAVESGDMETAQRMVDEAAKRAGYTQIAYHGGAGVNPYTGRAIQVFNVASRGRSGKERGAFFTSEKQLADDYKRAWEELQGSPGAVYRVALNLNGAEIRRNVYDAPTIRNAWNKPSDVFVVSSANQIKSADPVTYDDNGDVIPLSQRFNAETPDIRFKLPGVKLDAAAEPVFFSQLRRTLEAKMPNRMTVMALRGMIDPSRSGVKADEIEWTGLKDFLDSKNPGDYVTKAEVLEAVRDVEIQEVVKGNRTTEEEIQTRAQELFDEALNETMDRLEEDGREVDRTDISNQMDWGEYVEAAREEDKDDTNFSQYQLAGGKNYRELLLTLPTEAERYNVQDIVGIGYRIWDSEEEEFIGQYSGRSAAEADAGMMNRKAGIKNSFRSSHFSEPNILAHVRFNERTAANGDKTLFLEEVQSDWHQAGRERGYAPRTPLTELPPEYSVIEEPSADGMNYTVRKGNSIYGLRSPIREQAVKSALEELNGKLRIANDGVVPDAPFKDTSKGWARLAFKRMLRWAAENGFDRVAWTTGEQQAERYNLSKKIERVSYNDLTGQLMAWEVGTFGDRGRLPVLRETVPIEKSADYIGKEAAQKLIAAEPVNDVRSISGDDLRVGGEGMRTFYDKILPSIANDIGKKFGARVEDVTVKAAPDEEVRWTEGADGVQTVEWGDKSRKFTDEAEAKEFVAGLREGKTIVHSLPVTPTMRDSVMQGQPRFRLPGVTLDGGISAPVRVGELRTQTQLENDDPVGFPILDHIRGGSRIIIPRGDIGRKGEYNWFTSIGGLKAFNFAERKAFFRHPKAALGENKSHGNIDTLAKELEPQLGTDDVETFANAFMEEVERSRALYRVQKERQAVRRDALETFSESPHLAGMKNIGENLGKAVGSVYDSLQGEEKATLEMILEREGTDAVRDYILRQHIDLVALDMIERHAFQMEVESGARDEAPPIIQERGTLAINTVVKENGDTRHVFDQTKESMDVKRARLYAQALQGVPTITDEAAAAHVRESLDAGGKVFLRDIAQKLTAERLTGATTRPLDKLQTAIMLWYQTDLDERTKESDWQAQVAVEGHDLNNLKAVDMMRDNLLRETIDYLNAARQYGSLAGQALQALKLRVDQAFNIVKIYRQARENIGRDLTRAEFEKLKARIDILEKKWNDYVDAATLPDEQAELDARVAELEKKLADVTAARAAVKTEADGLEAKKAALEAEYAKQSGTLTELSEKKARLEAQIATLENEIAMRGALNQEVGELQAKVDALQAKLDALDAEYAGASPELLASLEKQLADLTKLHAEKLAAYHKADEELKTANERLKRVRKLIEKLGKGTKAKIARRRAVLENAANLYGEFKAEMERAQVEQLKARWRSSPLPKKALMAFEGVENIIQGLQSMADESVAGRQLIKLGRAHPIMWARAFAQSQHIVFHKSGMTDDTGRTLTWQERSDRYYYELDQAQREDPLFDILVRKGGLDWMDITADPTSFDEQQIPIGPLLNNMLPSKATRFVTSVLGVSNNHYAGMSNMLRFAVAKQLYNQMSVAKGETPNEDDVYAIVSTVDIFGSRGDMSTKTARAVIDFGRHLLYSPRLALANAQYYRRMFGMLANPRYSRQARKMILMQYVQSGITYATLSFIARVLSWLLYDDKDQQRFQFKSGHTAYTQFMFGQQRVDITGGQATWDRAAMNFLGGGLIDLLPEWAQSVVSVIDNGDKLATETGLVITEQYKRERGDYDSLGRFARSKLKPLTGMFLDAARGKNYEGQAAGPRAQPHQPGYDRRYLNLLRSIAPVPLSLQTAGDLYMGDPDQGITPVHNPFLFVSWMTMESLGMLARSLPINAELAQQVAEGYTKKAEELESLKRKQGDIMSDRKMSPEMKELKAGRIQDKLDRLRGL